MLAPSNEPEILATTEAPIVRPATAPRMGRRLAGLLNHRGVLAVIDQGVVSGASFLTGVIVGRALGKENLGVYYLALSILMLARSVQADVISAPYMMHCHRRKGRVLATYSGSSLLHEIAYLAVCVGGVLAAVAVAWWRGDAAGLTTTLLALAGALPFLLLREFMRLFSFSHLQMVHALLADALIATVQINVLMVLALRHTLSVQATFVAMGSVCAIACCTWFLIERHPLKFARGPIIGHWRENWSFARWGLAGQLVNRGAAYATPWIVALVHGDAETGVLAACTTLVNLAGTFVAGVSNFLTPRAARAFARGGVAELLAVLRRTATVFAVFVGTFCLVVWLFGEPIVRLIYGARYSGMGGVLTVLAIGQLASSLGLTAGNGLWAINRPGANFGADVATLIVSIALLAALVGPLGVMGAALSSCGGTIAGATIRWCVLAKLLGELRRVQTEKGGGT